MISMALRIATRKALGMTAEEFDAHEATLARNLKRAQQDAIRNAIRIGCDCNSTDAQLKEAIERCRVLGVVAEK